MSQEQVLVVEDDLIVARGLETMLNDLGYGVPGTACTGREAITLVGETRPDLVLMDIKLDGDLDGVQAADRIARRFDIPVIFVTAHTDEVTLQRAKITGPFGYIVKPCDSTVLRSTVETALYKHKTDKELREKTRLNQILLDSMPCVALLLRPHTREVVASNQVAADAGAVPGTQCFSTWRMRDSPCPWCLATELWRTGDAQHLEVEALGVIWDAHWLPISPDLYMHYAVDITGQRRMEAELQRAQKLESIGVLAGGIAHDFNNLLTSVLGNIALAESEAREAGREELVAMLEEARTASLQAGELTRQLLTFASGGAPVKETVSVTSLLRETVRRSLRGSDVCCEFDLAEDLWPVDADRGLICQAIRDLVINARQAMSRGGAIVVRAHNKALPIDAPGLPAGRYVVITIEYQGAGIPAEHLSQIFDPYFSTEQADSGLGLATAYSIVKRHGGHIRVESAVGEGATFSVYLPASSSELADAPAEGAEITPGRGRVLIMDDEKDVRAIAGRLLSRAGYEVEQAIDGAEAIEMYRRAHSSGSPFDVVILDLTIPHGVGGAEAIAELRAFDPQVKAIVSSGYSTEPVMADFEGYGFSGVVPKPYEPQQLVQAVSCLIGRPEDSAPRDVNGEPCEGS